MVVSNVAVKISAALAAPPAVARDLWLQRTWATGGGLPIIVLPRPDNKRFILPPLLEEQLVEDDSSSTDVKYVVTGKGTLFDLEDDSHSATVSFEPQPDGNTLLTWDVRFGVTQGAALYEALTKATVGGSVTHLTGTGGALLIIQRTSLIRADIHYW